MRSTLTILLVAAFVTVFSTAAVGNDKAHKALHWIEQELTEEPLLSRLHAAKLQEDAEKAQRWIDQEVKKNLGL
jgi:hypothetical protein